MLINDHGRGASDGRTSERLNRITGMVVTCAAAATVEHAEAACEAARQAFPTWSELDPNARRTCHSKTADIIEQRVADFTELVMSETGATASWAGFNVKLAASMG